MRITQVTPGTGSFYCGSCLRDHAATLALRRRGHDVLMLPLYLPFVLEEPPRPRTERIFMGGINLYLQQKIPLLSRLPGFVRNMLDRPGLLAWSSTKGDMTDTSRLGEMTISMLRGEHGRQAHELDRFIEHLDLTEHPDLIVLSNALLIGMAPAMRERLRVPIICTLHGEDVFLDSLPGRWREQAWQILRERAEAIDQFIAVSDYYGSRMRERLALHPDRVVVVRNGIDLDDYASFENRTDAGPPTIGYLARLCRDKGIDTLVDAFLILKARDSIPGLQLRAAGTVTGSDQKLVKELQRRIASRGLSADASFAINVTREEKLDLLRSVSVFSVPALYGESFGLYILEALAAGVPVVQPRHGAFPELIELTGGGVLCEPDGAESLANALEELLLDDDRRVELGARGRTSVFKDFHADRMAENLETAYRQVLAADQPAVHRGAAESAEKEKVG